MKKLYTFLILTTIGLKLLANPIALPAISISELYFFNSNEWKLELSYYGGTQSGLAIDSIFIYSSTDTVRLSVYTFTVNSCVFVITQDSLNSVFHINRLGDTITVVSYCMGMSSEDVLIYGNCQGASINFPRDGQSISRYNMFYTKDNSPSIGVSNDTTGMLGTISGIVYDLNLSPVYQRLFKMGFPFETTSNGEYSTRAFSKPTTLNNLVYYIGPNTTHMVSITGINFVMEPDSVIERDIYLLDQLITGFKPLTINSVPVKVYPNPISKSDRLIIDIDLPVLTSTVWVELTSIDGQLINKEKVSGTRSYFDMPSTNGLYILNVMFDNQIISSSRIVVNNE